MQPPAPQRVLRSGYRVPPFLLDRIELEFDLDPDSTEVLSVMHLRRNPDAVETELRLDGEQLQLLGIELDGRALAPEEYRIDATALSLPAPDAPAFTLRIRNRIRPRENTTLMGLYVSNEALFTQCEAEGMRRITWIPDRPDVLARYRVLLRADRARFPVLLSNGNRIAAGELDGGRHFALWEDPHPKPCYLFAIVAGTLSSRDETVHTQSGREALLQVWADSANLPRLEHAMASLRRAIAWDERRFGCELDLDRYMVVAAADFNMGAMENKGLNIFNTKYVLASPDVATDTDYAAIESIIGHEYFHNWSGNRVTCRDWFQLSLKEGLTVFRDQEFTRDRLAEEAVAEGTDPASARAIVRIDDVRMLRATQFPEDAGPMAHPIRPDSYVEISNFYTATVYEKGAEVVRMLQTLLGPETFRRGLRRYFDQYDGQAATCDQFVAAMAEASGRDLRQFLRWYAQAGTPRVFVERRHDASTGTLDLSITQSTPPTPGQPEKQPLVIPFAIGLVGPDGTDLPVRFDGETAEEAAAHGRTRIVALDRGSQSLRLHDVPPGTVPSLLRDFSAPVILEHRYSEEELAVLAAHDSDGFNRWEAGQKIALAALVDATSAAESGDAIPLARSLLRLFEATLADDTVSAAFRERSLQLPSEIVLAEQRPVVDPQAIHEARDTLRRNLGAALAASWRSTYHAHHRPEPYRPDPAASGRRALKNLALAYLTSAGDSEAFDLARAQLDRADNLTERHGALVAILHSPAPFKEAVLAKVERAWRGEPLLMNKWLALQATAPAQPNERPVLERVRRLLRHDAYSEKNPNSVYALVLGFVNNNPAEFHRADGSGYAFWTEQVLRLDRLNPIVAARVARALDRWRRYTPERRDRMHDALREVSRHGALSRDTREIVDKALAP